MHVIIAGGGFVRQGGVVLGWKERGLVFKAHRLLYHSTLCSRVIKKKKEKGELVWGMLRRLLFSARDTAPPWSPRRTPTVVSWEGGVSYERDTPAAPCANTASAGGRAHSGHVRIYKAVAVGYFPSSTADSSPGSLWGSTPCRITGVALHSGSVSALKNPHSISLPRLQEAATPPRTTAGP